jgi:hypothetical protein
MNNKNIRRISRYEPTDDLPSGVHPGVLEEWHPEFACLICEAFMAAFRIEPGRGSEHFAVAGLALAFISENGTSLHRKTEILTSPPPPEGWLIGGGKGWKNG